MKKSISILKAEKALAEVIDILYFQYKQDFVDFNNRTHKLGLFKEQVKSKFHDKINTKVYDMKKY